MNTVIVTGSSGFIGSNLCHRLCRDGYTVIGVDIDSPAFELPDAAESRTLDLTTSSTLPEADAIVHLAAHSQVQSVVDNPTYALENIEMTQHVLREAERMDACVINVSSRDVYGSAITPTEDDVTTDSPPMSTSEV